MVDNNTPVYYQKDGKIFVSGGLDADNGKDDSVASRIIADPGMGQIKVGIPDTHPLISELSSNPDNQDGILGELASKQTELGNMFRRRQYLQQKEAESKERLDSPDCDERELLSVKKRIHLYRRDIAKLDEDIVCIQRDIHDLSSSVSRKTHYDKELVLRNIRYLLSSSTIKLGQIEREASGCQPGYLSRLGRTATEPSLEFVVTVASKLGVSLEHLLYTDLTQITKTEQYLIDFIRKLEKDTDEGKLTWEVRTPYELNNLYLTDEMEPAHELFELYVEEPEYPEGPYPIPGPRFKSHNYGFNTGIAGNCYSLSMKNRTVLYLMDIKELTPRDNSRKSRALELWMTQTGKANSYVCSTVDQDQIRIPLINLYKAVEEWNKHPQVKDYLRSAIDSFMMDDLSDDTANHKAGKQ